MTLRRDIAVRAGLPTYWEVEPDASLRGVVRSISFSCDRTEAPELLTVTPDARGADVLVAIDLATGACEAEVFGFKTRAIRAGGGAPRLQMGFNLECAKLGRMFRVNASELEDASWPLHELLDCSDTLYDQLAEATCVRELQRVLARRLLPRVGPARELHFVDRALERIQAARGCEPMRALAAALGVGLKRLERGFRQHVGCTPKLYAQVVRFEAARRALERGRPAIQVAAQLGYSDQPHLTRELRRFGVVGTD